MYPGQVIAPGKFIKLKQGENKIMLCAYTSMHYALLLIDPNTQIIEVTDGLQENPENFIPHAKYALKKCSLYVEDIVIDCSKYHDIILDDEASLQSYLKTLSPNCYGMIHKNLIQQDDDYNCGPIACYKTSTLITGVDPCTGKSIDNKRQYVMDGYRHMVKIHVQKDELHVTKLKEFNLEKEKESSGQVEVNFFMILFVGFVKLLSRMILMNLMHQLFISFAAMVLFTESAWLYVWVVLPNVFSVVK